MPSTRFSRRRLLAGIGAASVAAVAGCASLPAGPTDGVTSVRRAHLSMPATPRPNEPTDAQVLALRAHLDGLVTAAEPLYARADDGDALPEDVSVRVGAGVPSVREFLAESADAPASMDYGFARSRVSYAGFALGYLRGWFGLDDPAGARERARDARASLTNAGAETPRRADETRDYLAQVGWAERALRFAWLAVDQHDGETDRDPPASRAGRAERVGTHYRQAAKARMHATAGRHYAREYRRGLSDGATPVVGALDERRDAFLSRIESDAPPRGRPRALADRYDDPAVAAYYRRLDNPRGAVAEQAHLARTAAEHGWHALGALAALRAAANLAGYEHAVAADVSTVRDGVAPAALFEAKRRVVRRVGALADRDGALGTWLAGEPARLVAAGEGYLDADVMDSRASARAVCFAFFRHAAGYAAALPGLLARVESA
ncbi:hypothetical protein [Halarchaeum grantii]|nr:hypothetical protein [Halarchaeum grantii]